MQEKRSAATEKTKKLKKKERPGRSGNQKQKKKASIQEKREKTKKTGQKPKKKKIYPVEFAEAFQERKGKGEPWHFRFREELPDSMLTERGEDEDGKNIEEKVPIDRKEKEEKD